MLKKILCVEFNVGLLNEIWFNKMMTNSKGMVYLYYFTVYYYLTYSYYIILIIMLVNSTIFMFLNNY